MFVDFISVFCYNLAVTASCKKYRKKEKKKKKSVIFQRKHLLLRLERAFWHEV
jgi:hypothetical protein